MKASGCKPEEIATLMGHAVDDTALTTYGKKANGTRNVKPKINEEEIKRVKRTTSSHKFKIDDLMKKKEMVLKRNNLRRGYFLLTYFFMKMFDNLIFNDSH